MSDIIENTDNTEMVENEKGTRSMGTLEPDNTETVELPSEGNSGVSEARKYRKRAQEAEAERDQLRGQVGALQTQLLDQYLAGHTKRLHKGEDFFQVSGVTIDDLITSEGTLDYAKIDQTLNEVESKRPYLFEKDHECMANGTLGMGKRERMGGGASWSDALG